MIRARAAFFAFSLLALVACEDDTLRPDYAIRVTPTAQGSVATPPTCPSRVTENPSPWGFQAEPQFGCATAQNLASMVEKPDDLVEGRSLGDMRGVTAVGTIRRYDNNQPRGLIWPGQEVNTIATTTAAANASALSGDVTGGSGSSSPAASTAGAAAAAP